MMVKNNSKKANGIDHTTGPVTASPSDHGLKQNALTRLLKDRKGAVLPIFGASVFALSLSAGIALDYSRLSQTKTVMTDALDAALMATGNKLAAGETSKAELEKEFTEFFMANVNGRLQNVDTIRINNFSVDFATGEISADIKSKVNTSLMSLANIDTVNVTSAAAAVFSVDPVEISMALDVTGSMQGTKIAALKEAATNAVDILIENPNSKIVRVGIVPYAASVNAGANYAAITTQNASQRCVTERSTANKYNNESFVVDPMASDPRAKCPDNEIVPLSANKAHLEQQINHFVASGSTAGHLGVAWSYYMLSSGWNDLWPNEAKVAKFSDKKTKKVAILMTDGEFNTAYTDESSSDIAIKTCENMKKDGISVYSIAFAAPDSAKQTLLDCASQNTDQTQYFYDANNPEQLKQAFADIAKSIKKLRLAK